MKKNHSTPAEYFNWKSHPFLDNDKEPTLTQAETRYLELAFNLLKQGKSFTITGPSGAGKTTLVNLLLGKLDPKSFLPLHLPYGGLVRNGLLRTVAECFRLESGKRGLPTLSRLHQHLLSLSDSKHPMFPVLVVD
ncbi:MAG: AAA family ATPase, partial [Planctomycetota bacterium]